MKHTSIFSIGIMVTLEIFCSIWSKIPVESSDALMNVPELLPEANNSAKLQNIMNQYKFHQSFISHQGKSDNKCESYVANEYFQ